MKRIIFFSIFIALSAGTVAATPASPDEAPTKEQLDAAKKAFAEGKTLHDQGKLPDAIEKFKESYRLSRNPLLLYNIALTLDENKQADNALFYYRKFLTDAPAAAAQRKDADARVKTLEKEKLDADLNGKKPDTGPSDTATKPNTTATKPDTTATKPDATATKPVKIKPAGTYSANDFQHQVVEEAPPQKPLDITAFVPEDSGFTVTLFYRGSGDSTFTAKPMKWRYKELVGRIPGNKVAGSSIQYYVEAKDQAGNVVTRSGKSTSPNLVNVQPGATPRFYPDITDDGEQKPAVAVQAHDEEEDPFHKKKAQPVAQVNVPTPPVDETPPTGLGDGYTDVGSKKFGHAKWGSTIAAGALVGTGVMFYVMAMKQASALADDSKMAHPMAQPVCNAPPCPFDGFDLQLQKDGQTYQTYSNYALFLGGVATVVAGYFWYRQVTAKKHGEINRVSSKQSNPETTWVLAPALGDKFTGAAAAARF